MTSRIIRHAHICQIDEPATRRAIGRRMRKLRKLCGWTQQACARALGVSQGAISLWERGERCPNAVDVLALSVLFSCTADDIISGTQVAAARVRFESVNRGGW